MDRMNLIWIISDTVRLKDVGYYGNKKIKTPTMDALGAKSVGFNRHYCASFPTMPARADFFTGLWTGCFMEWGPLLPGLPNLPTILMQNGYTTAAIVDTPFYLRQNISNPGEGMNYDKGFQEFVEIAGQHSLYYSGERLHTQMSKWKCEADRYAPRTFTAAGEWLEDHYKEDFFLCIDVWDPHEPHDAPNYYTELYWPGYDGEIVNPVYGNWKDVPGFTEEKVKKTHAAYCGEITMVDTWMGYFLKKVENMGLMEKTAIIFTTDHGFYFGEHGGLLGKQTLSQPGVTVEMRQIKWVGAPLYEETAHIPLLIYVPGIHPGMCNGLTSAIDLMPTVLDILNVEIPDSVEGHSLLPMLRDNSLKGREFVVSGTPFTVPPDKNSVIPGRPTYRAPGWDTTITTEEWSLLYSLKDPCELYHLPSDPNQEKNVIKERPEVARELHSLFVKFMKETKMAEHLVNPRLTLKL
jgi:arylsulfatase A-like enzyme